MSATIELIGETQLSHSNLLSDAQVLLVPTDMEIDWLLS